MRGDFGFGHVAVPGRHVVRLDRSERLGVSVQLVVALVSVAECSVAVSPFGVEFSAYACARAVDAGIRDVEAVLDQA